MRKNIKKHSGHYLVYLFTFGAGLVFILLAQGDSTLQARLIFLIAALYFVWAMVHHYVQHNLSPRVAIEYILIVVLGATLVLFLFGI